MSLRTIKLAEVDEAAILAQRATGLLLTISFVVLPILWSNMMKIMSGNSETTNPCLLNCNYDPWSEFTEL